MMRNEPFILEIHGLPNSFEFRQTRAVMDNAKIPASQWQLTLSLSKTPRVYVFFQFLQQMQFYDEQLQKALKKSDLNAKIERIFRFRGIFQNVLVSKPPTPSQTTQVASKQNVTANNSKPVQNKLADRIKQYDRSYNQKKQERVRQIQEKLREDNIEKKELPKKPKTGKVAAKKPHPTQEQLSNSTYLDEPSLDDGNTFITDNKSSRIATKTFGKGQKKLGRNQSFDIGSQYLNARGSEVSKAEE